MDERIPPPAQPSTCIMLIRLLILILILYVTGSHLAFKHEFGVRVGILFAQMIDDRIIE